MDGALHKVDPSKDKYKYEAFEDIKLIGVQSNHDVEYFGGPAAVMYKWDESKWKYNNLRAILWNAPSISPEVLD